METKTERQKLNRIKAVLAETGHTGKWLAEQLGTDPVTISKWCTNTSQPDLYTLNEISNLLKVDNTELIVSSQKRNSNGLCGLHLSNSGYTNIDDCADININNYNNGYE